MTTSRIRIKICGITNAEDAEAAIDVGADALGFNGFVGSKRYIDLPYAVDWISQLPPFISRIAVLVNPTLTEAQTILELPGIDALQFHGDESPEFCRQFCRYGFIRALAARDRAALEHCGDFGTRTILLDAYVPGAFGGTGQLIDLEMAGEFVKRQPQLRVILSGGLTPSNVGAAVRAVRPYGVDVASGVESQFRKKEKSLMREFVQAVREGA